MDQFRTGSVRVSVATQAAGMGADIPEIEQVRGIQTRRKKKVHPATSTKHPTPPEDDSSTSDVDSEGEGDNEGDVDDEADKAEAGEREREVEWVKKVDPDMRAWIEATDCRQNIPDTYFCNPPRTITPAIDSCCDNCDRIHTRSLLPALSGTGSTPPSPTIIPATLSISESSSSESSESDVTSAHHPNDNGKRPMAIKAREQRYSPGPFTAAATLHDPILNKLASHASIQTFSDLEKVYPDGWFLGTRHFDAVMDVLLRVDRIQEEELAQKKRQKHMEMELRNVAKRAEAEFEREKNGGSADVFLMSSTPTTPVLHLGNVSQTSYMQKFRPFDTPKDQRD
ncbi:hypothetical protein CVT24_007609 [Panaeolus cyanescens]|uniref:Uncharacterized protein n=1 Tax=Panaeolus cyanescens TaxID=181874 RepID=A0A409YKF7_9AGAR|nr:hypothetical protein CVT24_007609 [Panaeolus cyanescens]